jgi:hypothetical protein
MLRSFADKARGRIAERRGTMLTLKPSIELSGGGAARRARRFGVNAALAASLSIALCGCGMSSLTSGLGGGMFGGGSKSEGASVSEDQLLAAAKSNDPNATGSTSLGEVAAGCPRFIVAPRDNHITFYEPGRAGDGLAIMHRGEITKTARECLVEPGRVTVRYGFSGRVLLGPKGKPGNIALPLNVVVNDSKRAPVAGDKVSVDVAVAVDKPIGYFSAVRTVTFDVPEGSRAGEFELVVGFDSKAAGAG